jgi:2Fe-2S ferredoxin
MPTVRVEPDGLEYHAPAGATLMAAAQAAGLRWPTVCGGRAECTTCYVKVLDDVSALAGAEPKEFEALWVLVRRHPGARLGTIRLACQAVVQGDVTVFKRGVRQESHP